jgi:hypothetical protein
MKYKAEMDTKVPIDPFDFAPKSVLIREIRGRQL